MLYNWKTKTDKQIGKILTENQGRFEAKRRDYEDLWELIVKVFRPRRYDILKKYADKKGKRYGAKIFDQAPANALHKFTSGKLGYMVNRSVPWVQFMSTDSRLMRLDHVKRYCDEVAEQVLSAAGRSTFYSSVVPHTLDADSVGTSVMVPMFDERRDRIVFDTVHPKDSYVGVDEFGEPIIYHRTLRLTRMSALSMFGMEVLPKEWFKDNELKDILHEDDYIWAIYPNDDRSQGSFLTEDKPYKVFCLLKARTSKLVYQSGRDYFVICCRTGRESGAEYGTSIAADCLTAALVVNKLGEKSIEAAHRVVEPPVIASRTIQAVRRNPGAITYVDDINREGVKTWLDKQPWPITDAQMERLHNQIEDRMFIRFFEMLSAGDLKVKTAYEVSQMMGEKATLMSTIIDTFEQETLEPCLSVLIQAETEAGRMPDPPEELIVAGGKVDVRYLGPLAQLQRSLLRSKGTVDALAIIQQMMTMEPKVAWKFNWLEMAEDVAVAQGMPQKHVLSDEEVDKIRQEFEAYQQQAQQMAALESAGKAAPALLKAPEEGSTAKMLMGAV
jgi:hypothetical protein